METRTTTRTDWQDAGDAWGHAAAEWAYRFEPHARDAVEHVFDRLRVGPGRSLVDIACGSGYAIARADRLGATVAGIDASDALVTIARRRAPSADVAVGSMFDLPWDAGRYDAASSFNGIWGGCAGAVAEMARVLKPGGLAGITFWGPGAALDLRDYLIVVGSTGPGVKGDFKKLASIGAPGAAEAMFAEAGLEVIERGATTAVLEAVDEHDMWRCLRSAGAIVPSLIHTGEAEVRRLALDAVAPFRANDGTYRLCNEITHLIARKPT